MGKLSIKGSQTEQNLMKAFAGEAQARARYTFYSRQAQKDGYEQIAAIFAETAANEYEHSKVFFKFLEGGMVEFTASYPAGVIASTAENLKEAAAGEYDEWSNLYPEFAETAKAEGFLKIATAFYMIVEVERHHEARYKALLEKLNTDKMFTRDEDVEWQCMECGHRHKGKKAPDKCPICGHERAFFKNACECIDCDCGGSCDCK